MIKSILSVLLICSVLFAGNSDNLKPHGSNWQQDIPGTYEGTLFAAGYDMNVTTTFYLEDGVLHGEYLMDENGTMTPGSFSNISLDEQNLLTCTWTDEYGSGPARFVFADNCTGFAGYWSSSSGSTPYNWWGTKEEAEIQQLIRD